MNTKSMKSTSVRRSKRRWRREEGANIIEFALVFPLLMMTILGIVDFAFVLHHTEVLTNAAREGARVATLPGYGVPDVQNRVNEYTQMGGIPGTPTTTVTATTIPTATATWPATTVTVDYTHDLPIQPVDATVAASVAAGVRYPSVLRGRVLSSRAIASSWAWV